jgi:hypothetical protein
MLTDHDAEQDCMLKMHGGAPIIVSTYTDSETGDVIAVYSDGSTSLIKDLELQKLLLAAKNSSR